MVSPIKQGLIYSNPGEAADEAAKAKETKYMKYFDLTDTSKAIVLYMFAVEITGGLGLEARKLVRLFAEMSGKNVPHEYQGSSKQIK